MKEETCNKAYITTISGRRFDPTAPDREDIDITDIAHSLSLICRANGHFKAFFSVARHCVNCEKEAAARGYPVRVRLLCLLHDAAEAYMGDMTRPLKRQLPYYRECEARLIGDILAALDIDPPDEEEAALVKEIDDAMLCHEFRIFNGDVLITPPPVIHIHIEHSECPFTETKAEFLELYHALREEVQS
ncbi:MAG: hypothetical protein IIY93_07740 [Clostridia bacterium]|nr:hypothetical protein [Clostridia bacterium]